MNDPDYRQSQWEQEYQEWLADPKAQAEYKIWLQQRENERIENESKR